jgi:two-component system, NarL family, nitrate/nitrite response regulator NarL
MEKLRLLLLEPNKLVRAGIKKILCDLGVIVEKDAGGIQDAVSYLEGGGRPDLILMEFDAECGSPMETLRSIRAAAPEAKIVALTSEISSFSLLEALKAGISGLLNKDISPETFLHSLHLVATGEKVFPIHSAFLISAEESKTSVSRSQPAAPDLSAREVKVLQCLAGGLPNKLIARELNITETTVKAHVKTVMRKVDVENRTQAAIWCIGKGLQHWAPRRTDYGHAAPDNGNGLAVRRDIVLEPR